MNRSVSSQTDSAADAFMSGELSRRQFVSRLLALGLSVPAAGAVLAACSAKAPASTGSKGTVRFLIGPWTDDEIKHQQVIAAAFTKTHPKVSFTFKLYDWDTANATIDASLIQNAHDIYYFGEADYTSRAAQKNGFADITARVNSSEYAAEKAKQLYWSRVLAYGPKVIGLPVCSHFEDALFVNMDMVKAAGFDETFVDSAETFNQCVTKMTKAGKTYGLGIGMQLGGFGEWYQRARSAGGRYLSEDLKSVAIDTPAVVDATQEMVNFFKQKVAPPLGTFDYNTAPDAFIGGRLAIYSSDLTIAAVLASKPKPPAFEWAVLPYPPGSAARLSFCDLGLYAMNSALKDQDLGWEVLQWWTGGKEAAYWGGVSGTYPARTDAITNGYSKYSTKQLADAFAGLQKVAVGPEPFAKFSTVESQAEAQVARAYGGKITAAEAVHNIGRIAKTAIEA